MGRPKGSGSKFTQELADAICERLAEGKSLRAVCSEPGMPSTAAVLEWSEVHDSFGVQYARARERGYQLLADEIVEIADDSEGDVIRDDEGREFTNAERVARSRLRVDTRKWMLSKMLPKVYGDKLALEHSGTVSIADQLRTAKEKRRSES